MPVKRLKVICPVCNKEKFASEMFPGSSLRGSLVPLVQQMAPSWNPELDICGDCINKARTDFVSESLLGENDSFTEAEKEVIEAIQKQESVVFHNQEDEAPETFAERLADKIAAVGGSWTFILSFSGILIFWIYLNTSTILQNHFDPYPYILLNLVLSCLAALQAPVIMMSQNRKETKDRLRAEADYKTNLKAELEIRHLHIKLDQLISNQWRKLLEIQQVQMDMMKDAKPDRSSKES